MADHSDAFPEYLCELLEQIETSSKPHHRFQDVVVVKSFVTLGGITPVLSHNLTEAC